MTHHAKTSDAARDDEKATLSRESVARAAVDLLDAQGIKHLTMRRLAASLDAGVMSLYWHVDNKDEIFDLALDAIFAPPASRGDVSSPTDSRAQVQDLLHDWRAIMLRHPWSVSLLPRRPLCSNLLSRLDTLGALLSRAGVSEHDLNTAIWSLWNHVMGATMTRVNFERHASDKPSPTPSQASYQTLERSGLLHEDDWEGVFERGISFLLDGILSRACTAPDS